MTRFKAGDKVKVINHKHIFLIEQLPIGSIHTVFFNNENPYVKVKYENLNDRWYITNDWVEDFELVPYHLNTKQDIESLLNE